MIRSKQYNKLYISVWFWLKRVLGAGIKARYWACGTRDCMPVNVCDIVLCYVLFLFGTWTLLLTVYDRERYEEE